MITIRIGNDIDVVWKIFSRNGMKYSLEGRTIKLWLLSGPFKKEITDFEVQLRNEIHFSVDADDLNRLGIYKLELSILDAEAVTEDATFDFTEVFQIVSKVYVDTNNNILDGNVSITPCSVLNNIETSTLEGKSAYEIAVIHGYEGTESEWLASLKGETGEKGEQGDPLTWEDLTEEQKASLKGETGATGPQGPVGPQGNTGSSVEYPFELVNGLTETTVGKALDATQGKVLKDEVDGLDTRVSGISDSATHTYSSAETYYYWDGLSIPQGAKLIIKISGTASWASGKAWLVSNLSATNPGLGQVLPNGEYEITAPNELTKLGLRIYSLASSGTVVLDLKIPGIIDKTVGELSSLNTTIKDSVVNAINEVVGAINDVADDVSELSDELADVITTNQSYNLFDSSAIVTGYVKPADGSLAGTSDDDYKSSPLIPVTAGHFYYLSGRSQMGSSGIRCLSSDGTTVMKVKVAKSGAEQELGDFRLPNHNGDGTAFNGQFKTPLGAAFVQFTVIFGGSGSVDGIMLIDLGTAYRLAPYIPPYKAYGAEAVSISHLSIGDVFKFSGKKVRIFGGSVADYCNRFGGTTVMAELLGAEITDSAVSGAGYCSKSGVQTSIVDNVPVFPENCIPDQVIKATASGQTKYDVYLLWSSTNDAAFPVGEPSDYTSADNYDVQKLLGQCGGMNYCIKRLQEFAPEARIIIIGSMKWFSASTGKPSPYAKPLVDGQQGVAALQSLPFFSLYANAGVNEHNLTSFFVWTEEVEGTEKAAPYGDGTHPNSWAYQRVIGPKIAKQIAVYF